MLALWKKDCDKPRQHIKKHKHYFTDKGSYSQSYGFSSSHVCMWVLDYKESWVPKNWCFWTVVLEKTLESPLDSKEIKPVNPKGNQSWKEISPEAPILWPPASLKKTLMLGKIEGRRRRGHRRWDGWMVSPTWRTWVWASSGSWWRTGKPGVLQFMGLQRDVTEWLNWLNWTILYPY